MRCHLSPSRHLCAFSLPVLQICRKVYINSPETVSLSFLKPLCKTAFCYNASIERNGNQCPGCGAAGRGDAQHRATAPSPCTWDGLYPTAASPSPEGGQSGWLGWKGRCLGQRCDTPSPNSPSVPLLCPIHVLVPSFVFCLSYKSLRTDFSLQGPARLDLRYCSSTL